jgi:hypothetical protein
MTHERRHMRVKGAGRSPAEGLGVSPKFSLIPPKTGGQGVDVLLEPAGSI